MTWTAQSDAEARAAASRCWMTAPEFKAIWMAHFHRARERPSGARGVGIEKGVADKIMAGERPVKKVEALAITHFLLGFDEPSGGNFADWFTARFGFAAPTVAAWLELPERRAAGRPLAGVDLLASLTAGERPSVTLTRALDLLHRAGPFCPFGQ